jgi:hypothetical protein
MEGKSFIHHRQNMNATFNGGKDEMVKCKNCGAEVAKPRKSWKMAGRPDKAGKKTQLTIGLFDCPSCNKSFKVVLNKQKI